MAVFHLMNYDFTSNHQEFHQQTSDYNNNNPTMLRQKYIAMDIII
jgi:hypothetical protein